MLLCAEIPPTAVGGSFQMVSKTKQKERPCNPTNGSWWIVQILSDDGSEVSTHCRGWDYI